MITDKMKNEYSEFIRMYPESLSCSIKESNRIFKALKEKELKRIAKKYAPIKELEYDLLNELRDFYKE